MAKVQTNHMTELGLTKDEMVNTIICLLGLENEHKKQYAKMSIAALNATYEALSDMGMQWNKAKQEARFANEHLKTEERRSASFERDLRRVEKQLKAK